MTRRSNDLERQRLAGGRYAQAVGIATRRKYGLIRIAGRDEDRAPVVQHVVHRKQRGLLPAVGIVGAGEAGGHLVGQHALHPQAEGGVDVLLELRGDIAEASG